MPRKTDKLDEKWFAGKVADVFVMGATSEDERRFIAYQWCSGNYEYVHEFCERKPNLLPIAVLVAALLDIEHPLLVVNGKMLWASLTLCSIEVLRVELQRRPVHIPLWTSGVQLPVVHRQRVRMEKDGGMPTP